MVAERGEEAAEAGETHGDGEGSNAPESIDVEEIERRRGRLHEGLNGPGEVEIPAQVLRVVGDAREHLKGKRTWKPQGRLGSRANDDVGGEGETNDGSFPSELAALEEIQNVARLLKARIVVLVIQLILHVLESSAVIPSSRQPLDI